jgi:hypothetical protein
MADGFAFDCTSQAMAATFDGSTFTGKADFRQVVNLVKLSFIDCTFAAAPIFGNTANLPQDTRFARATFTPRPEDEPSYRVIREHFSENGDRDSEGRFYALEKHSQRLGLPWGFTRLVSFLYDMTSVYGQSYARAFCWFCLLQLASFLGYAYLSDELSLCGTYDGRVLAFTFAQLVKPFELFTNRPAGGVYGIVGDRRLGVWQFLTAGQSILSLALLALFLLALRCCAGDSRGTSDCSYLGGLAGTLRRQLCLAGVFKTNGNYLPRVEPLRAPFRAALQDSEFFELANVVLGRVK